VGPVLLEVTGSDDCDFRDGILEDCVRDVIQSENALVDLPLLAWPSRYPPMPEVNNMATYDAVIILRSQSRQNEKAPDVGGVF
jgi:hypothetical protein